MAQILEESNLKFKFNDGLSVIKFDESNFYTQRFNALQGSKGVDFLVDDPNRNIFYFIEVKNFTDHEIENKKRILVNTDNSLALEVARKVRDSIACLFGAFKSGNEEIISPYFNRLGKQTVQIRVILFLEGNFYSHEKVFKAITDEMKSRLKWLTSKVIVENIQTTKNHIYSIERLPLR